AVDCENHLTVSLLTQVYFCLLLSIVFSSPGCTTYIYFCHSPLCSPLPCHLHTYLYKRLVCFARS
uniref:Uncharacterized protein n=1 Tax=Amphiprion percula TaxID=161767 RepID=A0A3P8TGS8_AMPPE